MTSRRMSQFNEGEHAREERRKYQKTAQVLTLFIISYIGQWWPSITYFIWSSITSPPDVSVSESCYIERDHNSHIGHAPEGGWKWKKDEAFENCEKRGHMLLIVLNQMNAITITNSKSLYHFLMQLQWNSVMRKMSNNGFEKFMTH